MKRTAALLICLMLFASLITLPSSAADELTLKRAVCVSNTQIVLEFSAPIAINMNGNNYGPWISLRILDSADNSIWGQGPRDDKCLQYTGTYEFLDENHDKLLWTITLGSLYDNSNIKSICNFEGDMAQWSANTVKIHIEEVPYDQGNPGSDYNDNITTADGSVNLRSNVNVGAWAATVADIEFDFDYPISAGTTDNEAGTQKLTLNSLPDAAPAPEKEEGFDADMLIGAGIGVAATLIAVLIVSLVRRKKA